MKRANDRFSRVQLYTLGLLHRYGPQHGYSLKRLLDENVADFARIELGNIYYHLGRMAEAGVVEARAEKDGRRPERAVYSITERGEQAFDRLLGQALCALFIAEFDFDAVLFFSDRLDDPIRRLRAALALAAEEHGAVLEELRRHRDQVTPLLPDKARIMAEALFRHHEIHLAAELSWIDETMAAVSCAPEGVTPARAEKKGKRR